MHISFILVEPAVPENIGAAARAIKTMGFSDLRLVNTTGHLADEAKWLAHGSLDILESASVYTELRTAIEDLDFVIGTTAKNRSVKEDYYSPEKAKEIVVNKESAISSVGIVFGREESGLTNQELNRCDIASSISLKHPYPSVNLAQSVMIFAYVFSSLALKSKTIKQAGELEGRIFHELKKHASTLLHEWDVANNPNLYHRIMERLSTINNGDARLLLSIIKKYRQKFE